MNFTEKEYQQRALDRFDAYVTALITARFSYDKVAELKRANPELPIPLTDFAQTAWENLRAAGQTGRNIPYSPRTTGDGHTVPNATFKLPTGGGKTYLATAAVARLVTRYLRPDEPRFVLWVVPSEAIYAQTKRQLTDREHPYRQLLDRFSGGRVRILEKTSPLTFADVEAGLNVMLLMLPSANRETKDSLRIFRDRGDVFGFLPPDDDLPAHGELVRRTPNLDYIVEGAFGGPAVGSIKNSLGNALRVLRPIVVMDEGQKAFGKLAHDTLYGFNPRFVLELSATPRDATDHSRTSNWLTNISGSELEHEEMIKMPIRLDARETPDWRECLRRAWEQTQDLQRAADDLRDNSLRYIRPILLVQTERTGNRNADDGTVHALDAKELLISLGVEPEAVKLKTADTNEIEGLDLLSPSCPVRVIITKSALQEGWDCPFAYVLCSLTPAKSLSGMTQLIGRILRQPHAQKTGVAALDRCYVFTSFSSTQAVFKAIKDGLEGEGMGDLAGRVQLADGGAGNSKTLVRERRAEFRNLDYFLPTVCFRESDNSVRALDWESDILAKVDWSHISLDENAKSTYLNLQNDYRRTVDVGLEIIKGARPIDIDGGVIEREEFDLVYAVRVLSKQIPNPFIAARLIQEFLAVLPANGFKPKDVATQQRYLVEQMQIAATAAVEAACREVFEQGLRDHRILFNLKTASGAWQVPHTSETTPSKIESRADGKAFQFDLFEPTYAEELNGLEYKLASYADRSNAIDWWYRNVVRGDGYGLQGWRKNRAYPDFILAQTRDEHRHWVVLETKGDQLSGNLDTNYKDELMQRLVAAYQDQQHLASVGELEILDGNETFDCRIILETGWERSVGAALAA